MQVDNTKNQILSAADRLISAHDGDVALLYIYRLRNGSGSDEQAAHDLCRTAAEIAAAAEKLDRMGLGSSTPAPAAPKLAPAAQLPQYSSREIVRRSKEDGVFSGVVAQAQTLLGRTLSGADMMTLFGIYDYLAMPPELIMELMTFCVETYREKYGEGRLPSMRSIEKEAYVWANREILTFEQAEEYIRQSRARREDTARIAAALNIRGRELTATEKKYIGAWLEMGFGEDAIAEAYDRTVTNTGALKWSYMDKIVCTWHSKGLHTAAQIEEKDPRRTRSTQPSASDGDAGYSIDELRSILDKV